MVRRIVVVQYMFGGFQVLDFTYLFLFSIIFQERQGLYFRFQVLQVGQIDQRVFFGFGFGVRQGVGYKVWMIQGFGFFIGLFLGLSFWRRLIGVFFGYFFLRELIVLSDGFGFFQQGKDLGYGLVFLRLVDILGKLFFCLSFSLFI